MRITIDAGHGMPDPGAVGNGGLRESDVTLTTAQIAQRSLLKLKHQVTLTRTGPNALDADKGKDLAKRCQISNNANAEAFISFHCNSAIDHGAGGFEIFHAPKSKAGALLAASILATVQAAGLVQGGKTGLGYKLRNRGIKQAAHYVTKHTKAPAVLIELAFLSNPTEEALLGDNDWLERMVAAIADGIDKWGKRAG